MSNIEFVTYTIQLCLLFCTEKYKPEVDNADRACEVCILTKVLNAFVLVIVWTRVQLTINSRVVSTKTSKLSESVGRGTI